MVKAMFTCPHCHKTVRDLKAHIARMHPADSAAPEPAGDSEPEAGAGESLKIKPPAGSDAPAYHCIGCGAALEKGQTPCPACGEALSWESLDNG